jgi:hypothetical protein
VNFPNPHAKIDEENRERDRRLADMLRRRPQIIDVAKKNLARWIALWGESNPAWDEWSLLLRMLTPQQLADFLESNTPKANRLRQSSPFLGPFPDIENAAAIAPDAA